MRFVLDEKHIIVPFGGSTPYQGKHNAIDYRAKYVSLYMPEDGEIVSQTQGYQGGNWLTFKTNSGYRFRAAHLSKYEQPIGTVHEGDIIAITGDTGAWTTGPHLHLECSKNNILIDPEEYFNMVNKDRLIQLEGDKDVYRLREAIPENGDSLIVKDLFLNAQSFERLDGRWDSIEKINQEEFDKYPRGDVFIVAPSE